jgi:outer-membrane receptor for ferric coprogen and ferric-rhodotorulic acid
MKVLIKHGDEMSIKKPTRKPQAYMQQKVLHALLATSVGMAILPLSATWSFVAAAESEAVRSYDIPAGPLDGALGQFAGEAGVVLSFEADQARHLTTKGLKGNYSVRQGFASLLQDSGLQAVEVQSGRFSLKTSPANQIQKSDADTLPEVQVKGQHDKIASAVTEDTGSYTTDSMNTATKLPMSIRETPQSVSVMTRQRMNDQGLTTLTDVIQQTAGLTMSQSGNMGSDTSPIYSRGFQVENYQVDGVSHLNSSYTGIFQTSDMALYDRVEVVRGATGLMNGIGTPSATLNMVRKKPTAETQGYVRAEGGSWDRFRLEADGSTSLNADGSVRGRGVVAWQENNSYIDRLQEDHKVVYGVIEADLAPNTLLTVGLTWQQHNSQGHSRGGLPLFNSDGTRTDWKRSDSAAASWAYSRRENLAAFAALEQLFDNGWKIKGTYSYDRTSYDEQLGYAAGGNPDKATGAGVTLYAGRWAGPPIQNTLDIYAAGPFNLLGRQHDFVAGMTYAHTKLDSQSYLLWHFLSVPNIYTWNGSTPGRPDSSPVGDYNYTEQTKSIYATARFKPLDSLSVILGARNTSWQDETYNRSYSTGDATTEKRKWDNQVTPYAGVVFDVTPEWSVYASYTDIFKPQSNRGTNGAYLDPLLGKAYEVGSKTALFGGKLNFSAAVYKIEQDNLAVAIPGVFAPDGSQAYRAASGATTRGYELELGGQLAQYWQASASFVRNLSQDAEGVALNTDVPQNTFKLFSTYSMPWVGNGLTVGGGLRWQRETWSDFTWMTGSPRVTQGAYSLVDLMARYNINKQWSATFNAYNLFDKTYQTSSSSSYYGEPRSARLGLVYRF